MFALYSLPTRLIRPHARLLVAAAAMVAFITSLLALSGAAATSLLNLYLLPIVMSALTLGRTATLLVMALLVLPYADWHPRGVGVWFARERRVANGLFAAIALAVVAVTIVGTFFRGPNWAWVWPW